VSAEELLSLGLSRELVVLVIAALPILELRGAIPLAINLISLSVVLCPPVSHHRKSVSSAAYPVVLWQYFQSAE
jgi:hypothetical protein